VREEGAPCNHAREEGKKRKTFRVKNHLDCKDSRGGKGRRPFLVYGNLVPVQGERGGGYVNEVGKKKDG